MPLILALALAAPSPAVPLVTRNADGSVTLERRIEAEPPPLARLTHGLVEGEWEKKARRKRRQAEADADLREAFEEAVDQARASQPD